MGYGNERLVDSPDVKRRMIAVAREFRKEPTKSEDILWQAIRGMKLNGVRFRRQQPIGCFVVDFFAPMQRLIVEVDGSIHEQKKQADLERQALLESLELRFVRVGAEEVEGNLEAVLRKIAGAFRPHPPAPSPTRGEGENNSCNRRHERM
jgi:adenine-specific DNA-methyltransferase